MSKKESVLLWVVRMTLIVFAVLGIIFLFVSISKTGIVSRILPVFLTIFFLGFSGILFLKGFKTIPNEKRWVIEILGKYHGVYGPGLAWLTPFVMKAREAVPISEQKLRLYNPETEHNNKIDFVDGSAAPLGAFAFVQVIGAEEILQKQAKGETIAEDEIKELDKNIFCIVYAADNAQKQIINLTENMTRSFLNGFTVDEATKEGGAGFDVLGGIKRSTRPEIQTEHDKATKSITKLGVILRRVTVADFDLDEKTVAARTHVQQMQKDAEAAKHKAKTFAAETMGVKMEMLSVITGASIENIQKEINSSPQLKEAFGQLSTELLKLKMGYDTKGRFDIGVDGAEGGLKDILSIIMAAVRGGPAAASKKGATTSKKSEEDS
jgi:hypothetical protein